MNHWIKSTLRITLIGVFVVSLAACGKATTNQTEATTPASQTPATQEDTKITVQDAVGTVELPKKPERIVTMEFGFTDALVTLGVKPVGIADDDDSNLLMDEVKTQLKDYKSVGSRYEPNIELISSLQPDLIIVDINKHKNAIPQLKAIAPLLILDDFQADYSQMLKNYTTISIAVGKEEEGKKRLAEHETKMEALKKEIKHTDLRVLPAVVNPKGFYAHSDHSYTGSFLAMLGFTDPVKNSASYPQLTLEQLVEVNPQALFLMPVEKENIDKQWESNPLWQKIDAVANKKIFTVARRDWSLSRGLIGSEKMAEDIAKSLGE
ncbi:ABC transporter substrate-binding protein [Paenibacillus psychroresistens]|uniref:ABC transporter substrate-binding protein n=1 Tax=Paenibacillus psychroresistens TaxID=1778678 RepID=A0A6B8RVJ6_9BACL|nr:Fe(3+) dicitrate ABC transporter substrate-binding protein [Paenibacillus psychroresistens]QGQ99306.1 ABC transporter substrate-binding protein [Paenibacillus psychroresistens]